ncbi:MAG: D-alanine--D-alanine ligase [bacterium]|nr:D-alanine--D-alanine ligase [bacterium]
MAKIKVALLMGGQSSEHEVSLASGKMIVEALDKKKYDLKPITIAKNGKWLLPHKKTLVVSEGREALDRIKFRRGVDVVFIALHGNRGEDGAIQGLLELAGVPYTGSGVLTSALAMDKEMTKKILKAEGILMPNHVILEKNYQPADLRKIKLPVVIKPVREGSSVGISVVKKKSELLPAIEEAFQFDSRVMAEEFVRGKEITAAVLGNKKSRALPLIEIRPNVSSFFDYRAKYEAGGSEEICPAPIGRTLTKKIQDIAVGIHRVLGCRGVTRSDFILRGNKPYFLEINTIPGMTKTSLVPQAAERAGLPFPELLDKLIELALLGD